MIRKLLLLVWVVARCEAQDHSHSGLVKAPQQNGIILSDFVASDEKVATGSSSGTSRSNNETPPAPTPVPTATPQPTLIPTSAPCTNGNGAFLLATPVLTWAHAEQWCVDRGGHLASIHSAEDDAVASAFMKAETTSSYPWLGGYSTPPNTISTYEWSDGTPWNYTHLDWNRNDAHPNFVSFYRSGSWGTFTSAATNDGVCRICTVQPTCEHLMDLANGEGSTFATYMRSCFSTNTYDVSNNQWLSTVGGYTGTFSGAVVTAVAGAAWTNGALNQDQSYLLGTTASKVAFGEIKGAGSFCAKTRYTGDTQKRILTGETTNWLFGHYIGKAGVAFDGSWIMDVNRVSPTTDWVTMCCQNAGQSCWVNGVKYTGNTVTGGVTSVSINQGISQNQVSDWGAAFIASWDSDLSDTQIEIVQRLMMSTDVLCAPSSPRAVVVNAGETLILKTGTECSSNWVTGTNSYRLCSDHHHDKSFTAADFADHSGWSKDAYGWSKTGLSLAACKDFCENDLRGCTAVKSDGNQCFVLKNAEEEAACAGTTDNAMESYYDTASSFELTSLDIKAGGKVLAQGENPVRVVVSGTVIIDGIFNVSGPRGNNAGNDQPSAGGGAGGGALLINSLQSITVNGHLLADGGYGGDAGGPGQSFFTNGEGSDGKGGIGVAGGWNGGDGTGSGQNGMPGFGPGASGAGATGGSASTPGSAPPGAGGAGYATQGGNGFCQNGGMCPQVPGGPAYGDGALSGGLFGGSGAGSGGNDNDNEEGAGGGGSGGTIWLSSPSITIGAGATVSAMGGLGGLDDYEHNPGDNRNGANNGGPGSAGRIRIDSLNSYSKEGVTPEPFAPAPTLVPTLTQIPTLFPTLTPHPTSVEFSFHTTPKSWHDARTHCLSIGGDLASIHTDEQSVELHQLRGESTTAWLGLTDENEEGTWTWSDGSPLDYTRWSSGEPNNAFNGEDCGIFKGGVETWNDFPCSSTSAYICQFSFRNSPTPVPTSTPTPAPTLVPTLTQIPTLLPTTPHPTSVEFSFHTTPKSWHDARTHCLSIGGDLASIHTDEQSVELHQLRGESTTAWLGLTDENEEGTWTWSDGSPLDYTRWSSGEPNNAFNGENCGIFKGGVETWNDFPCSSTSAYICQFSFRNSPTLVPTLTQIPTLLPTLTPHPTSVDFSFHTTPKSWHDARTHCLSFGGDLASIHTDEQNVELHQLRGGSTPVWLGLTDENEEGTWIWSDGSPLDYTRWSSGEPNNSYGEDCGGFYGGEAWNDFPCSSTSAYICQFNIRNSPTPVPTSAPTPAPTSVPTNVPTTVPTPVPSATKLPTPAPIDPSPVPTASPTTVHTVLPSLGPSLDPSSVPTSAPTTSPLPDPSPRPTVPSPLPTPSPSPKPTSVPTLTPSPLPTQAPKGDVVVKLPAGLEGTLYVLQVNEDGSSTATSTFTVSLTAPPLSDVKVSFTPTQPPSEGGGKEGGKDDQALPAPRPLVDIEPRELVFTYQDYDLPRTVTVSAAKDDAEDQGEGYFASFSTEVKSGDKLQDCKRAKREECGQAVIYDGLRVDALSVFVVDDDEAGLAVSEVSAGATFDNYGDALSYAYFTVALTSAPAFKKHVKVAVGGVADAFAVVSTRKQREWEFTEGRTELEFSDRDWMEAVTVAVAVGAPNANRPVCPGLLPFSTDGGRTCGALTSADGNSLRYTMAFDLSGSDDGTYLALFNTSQSTAASTKIPSVGITASVVYDTIEPPALVSAQFDNLLNSVWLKFDTDTDRAKSLGLSPEFKCHSVLDLTWAEAKALFGSNSKCTFAKPDALKVVFGNGASIEPGHELGIRNHAVRSSDRSASLFMHNRAAVAVSGSAVAVVPQVKLSASSPQVGVCDDLKLDASKSSGSGGRAMVYAWSVDALSSHNLANVTAVLGQATAGGLYKLTLPAAAMPAGSVFEVTLNVTNFLFETSSSKVKIRKLGVPAPTIKVQGDNPLTSATHSSALTLAATAELPTLTCVDLSLASARMEFVWHDDSGHFTDGELAGTSKNPRVLVLPAGSLASLTEYDFRVVGTMADDPSVTNEASVAVQVGQQDLVASIGGGASRQAGRDTSFALDGAASVDPDESSGSIAASWSCVASADDSDCGATISDAAALVTSVPAAALPVGTYVYSLRVSKTDGRVSSSVSVVVEVVAGSPPVVEIASLEDKYNVEQEHLKLTGTVVPATNALTYTSEWSVSVVGVSGDSIEETGALLDLSGHKDTVTDQLTTVFFLKVLTPGTTYTLTLSAMDSDGTSASTTVKVTLNEAPSSGSVVSNPTIGFAFDTLFGFTAVSWVDTDLPLTYVFGTAAMLLSSEPETLEVATVVDDTKLSPFGDERSDSTYDGAVLKKGVGLNFTVGVFVQVADSFGAKGNSTGTISVAPKPLSVKQLRQISENRTRDAIAAGNADAAKQVLDATCDGLKDTTDGGQRRRALLGLESSTAAVRASVMANLVNTYAITPITQPDVASLLNVLVGVVDVPSDVTDAVALAAADFLKTVLQASAGDLSNAGVGLSAASAEYVGTVLTYLFETEASAKGLFSTEVAEVVRLFSIAAGVGIPTGVGSALLEGDVDLYTLRSDPATTTLVNGGNGSVSLGDGGASSDVITAVSFGALSLVDLGMGAGTSFTSFDVRLATFASNPYANASKSAGLGGGAFFPRSLVTTVEVQRAGTGGYGGLEASTVAVSGLDPSTPVRVTLKESTSTLFSGATTFTGACSTDATVLNIACPDGNEVHTCAFAANGGGNPYIFVHTCSLLVPTCLWYDETNGEFSDTGCAVQAGYSGTSVTCECTHLTSFVLGGSTTAGSFVVDDTEAPTTFPTNEPTSLPTMYPTAVPTAPSPEPTPEPTFQPTPYPTNTPAPTPGTPAPTLLPSLQPTSEPTLPPTPLPTGKPSTAPTAGDTFAVSVQFTLTSALTPNDHRTAQLKVTVEERVAADLGVSSVFVDDFTVTSVQTSARRRLGSGSAHIATPTRKLTAVYEWTASFTVKASLAAAGLSDHAALGTSVSATVASAAFVSQALSRAKADVDTASVASGVTTINRSGVATTGSPTGLPTAVPLPSPTAMPAVAAPPTASPVASTPAGGGTTPAGGGTLTATTTSSSGADSGSSNSGGGDDGGADMASLGGAVGAGLAVLLLIVCLIARYRKKQAAKELEMKSMDTADKNCAFEERGGKGNTMGEEEENLEVAPVNLPVNKVFLAPLAHSDGTASPLPGTKVHPSQKPLAKTPIVFPLGTSLDHKPTGVLKARVDAVDGVVGGVTKEGSSAGGGAGRSAAAPHKQVSLEEFFNLLNENGDGELSLQEVVAGSGKLGMTPAQAQGLFYKLDTNKNGVLTRCELQDGGLAGLLGGAFGSVGDSAGGGFPSFADTPSSFFFNPANTPANAATAAPASENEDQGSSFFESMATRSVAL